MFKILQKFLPEIINLLLTFYLQAWYVFGVKIGVIKLFLTVSESNWCKLIVTELLILV